MRRIRSGRDRSRCAVKAAAISAAVPACSSIPPVLAAMRTKEDSLSPEAAIDAVLRDNLFGLEIAQFVAVIA